MSWGRRISLHAGLVVAHSFVLVWCAFLRPIDADEGFYAGAAQLVAGGSLPYVDFFFPQAPALPFLYAPVAALAPGSLIALRLWSVVFGMVSAVVIGRLLNRFVDDRFARAVGLVMYLANPGVIAWIPVVKTYALANCLVLLGLAGCLSAGRRDSGLRWSAAGLCFGLAALTRLLYAPAAVAMLVLVVYRQSRANALAFGVGLSCCVVLFAALFAMHPAGAIFGNLGYHAMRATPPSGIHWVAAVGWFLLSKVLGVPYLILSATLCALGVLRFVLLRCRGSDCIGIGAWEELTIVFVALAAASLVPWPLYVQYFEAPIAPFAALLGATGVSLLPRRYAPIGATIVCVVLAGSLAARTPVGANSGSPEWRMDRYEAVVRSISHHSRPGDVVLAQWPGYVFGSHRRFFRGMENHFAMRVVPRLSSRECERLQIATPEDAVAAIEGARVAVVVLGAWTKDFAAVASEAQKERLRRALTDCYTLRLRLDSSDVYERTRCAHDGQEPATRTGA
jgi:4-amino-4-deoxy-L-arabinose transferase-like glycosyltransferase